MSVAVVPSASNPVAIQVAGQIVPDALRVISCYFAQHAGTLERYDRLAGTSTSLSLELVTATRLFSSRIHQGQARWFVSRGRSAPWHDVPADADLRDADPLVQAGLYDAAERLYQHFHQDRPKQVNRAKISKCLYLMRPGLIPVLDSRLVKLYRRPAATAARILVSSRPDRPPVRRAYWASIRLDLEQATDALARLRASMRSDGTSLVAEAADLLSDLRLLDILAWKAAAPRSSACPAK